jgi:DNA (cytosine-5)-methyltransferase 1
MRVGSLFSGIGGLDLGLERAGMTVVWQSEIDPYASRVLAKHWPTVPNLGDITTIDWSNVEPVDLICGGYPCPGFSTVGLRRGLDDDRYLWPPMLDAIRILRPRFALLENVSGHLSLGFDEVLADLAGIGFDAEWSIVPACAFGAPHSRERLFCVAHTAGRRRRRFGLADYAQASHTTRSDDGELEGSRSTNHWAAVPAPGVLGMAYGIRSSVDRARLKAYGNAVVPQVAEWVGRRIMEAAA